MHSDSVYVEHIAGSAQYCRNHQLSLFEKIEFECLEWAVKA